MNYNVLRLGEGLGAVKVILTVEETNHSRGARIRAISVVFHCLK